MGGACSIDNCDSEQNKRQQEAGFEANLMSKRVATLFSDLATRSKARATGGTESKQGVSPPAGWLIAFAALPLSLLEVCLKSRHFVSLLYLSIARAPAARTTRLPSNANINMTGTAIINKIRAEPETPSEGDLNPLPVVFN